MGTHIIKQVLTQEGNEVVQKGTPEYILYQLIGQVLNLTLGNTEGPDSGRPIQVRVPKRHEEKVVFDRQDIGQETQGRGLGR